jgi:hypothetical protein
MTALAISKQPTPFNRMQASASQKMKTELNFGYTGQGEEAMLLPGQPGLMLVPSQFYPGEQVHQ